MFDILYKILPKKNKFIEVVIPIGFMNCGITINNDFIADTNNTLKWDTLKFPLPKPRFKWHIRGYTGDANYPEKRTVELVDMP